MRVKKSRTAIQAMLVLWIHLDDQSPDDLHYGMDGGLMPGSHSFPPLGQ